MRNIDKALAIIDASEYNQRHMLELEAMDRTMTLMELVIDKYCPRHFGMPDECRYYSCIDCWALEEDV